ncbi:MAG TPA: outer membrane lipoprotein-sorting protein, partial [Gammaproteobacteria bacterium]
MRNLTCVARGLALLLLVCGSTAQAEDVTTMLKRADALRLPDSEAKVETRVRLYEDDTIDKERLYTVYMRPGHRSLVLFKSAGEAGQKVLMLDDAYWMFMPNTRRPLRITPMQKLLGEASTGDIATLTWSEDYSGKLLAEEVRDAPCSIERPCRQLELTSVRTGTTYERIELWLDQADVPLFARLYLASG